MSANKLVAIVNPVAGKGKCARLWPEIERYLSELGISLDVHLTQGKGDATRIAAAAAAAGSKHILSVGGDGTLNEVANGVLAQPVTIGVIPAGSGNDFVRSLGLRPDDWRGACQIIAAGQTRMLDLGQINGRHFVNVAGVGFDAAAANCANVWAKQRFPGSVAYVAALLRTLIEFKPTDLSIELDDRVFRGQGWLVVVANAQFFGGGMRVAPKAILDDGLFDVCILGELSKINFLTAFPRVFTGTHLSHPAVHYFRSRQVKVTSRDPLFVQADGELIGQTPQLFQLHPQALSFFCRQEEQ